MEETMQRQTTFTFGEVDRQVWKRTDVKEYLTAAQSLLNMEVGTTGLAKKRKGTLLLLNVTGNAQSNSRMYEFVDIEGNHYVIISTGTGAWYVFATPTNEAFVVTNTGSFVVDYQGNYVTANISSLIFVQAIEDMPYQDGDLDNIDYTQDNDALILTNQNYPPGRIYISSYTDGFPVFAFQVLAIYPLPAYDFNYINYNNFTVQLAVSGTNNSILTFKFTGLSSDPGFNSAWDNGQIIGGGATDIDPVGYAIINSVDYSAGTTTFVATVQVPFQVMNYATQGSQYSIRQPAWSEALGYPAKTAFYQNRLWLGNTPNLSNTLFGSKINSPINFDVGTGRDTDAIVYTIGQTQSGAILWMNGGKQFEVYCQYNEFACPQEQNLAITPNSFVIRQQSAYGASKVLKPITYINDSYYTTKTGVALINFHFNGIGQTYTSSNVSAASSHLVKVPTNRALLRGTDTSQDNFIYLINPDNTITAFQFATEYKLAALTPVVFQDNVELIDIVTIDNSIYILKYYTLTQQYTIEQFDDTTRIDCTFNATMQTSGLVTGLSLLNGYTVQVVFNGQDYGQYLVSGGQITVTNLLGLSGNVMVGLLYHNECIPMYPLASANQSPFKKQVQRIYVDYYESLVFNINGDLVPYQTFADIQQQLPPQPRTDTAIVSPFSGWNRFDNNGVPIISITQSSPFDLQILSIGYQIAASVL